MLLQTLFQPCGLCWDTLCIWSTCVWQSSSWTLSLAWSPTSPSTSSSTSGSLPQRPIFWWVYYKSNEYCSVSHTLFVYYNLQNQHITEPGKAFLLDSYNMHCKEYTINMFIIHFYFSSVNLWYFAFVEWYSLERGCIVKESRFGYVLIQPTIRHSCRDRSFVNMKSALHMKWNI